MLNPEVQMPPKKAAIKRRAKKTLVGKSSGGRGSGENSRPIYTGLRDLTPAQTKARDKILNTPTKQLRKQAGKGLPKGPAKDFSGRPGRGMFNPKAKIDESLVIDRNPSPDSKLETMIHTRKMRAASHRAGLDDVKRIPGYKSNRNRYKALMRRAGSSEEEL